MRPGLDRPVLDPGLSVGSAVNGSEGAAAVRVGPAFLGALAFLQCQARSAQGRKRCVRDPVAIVRVNGFVGAAVENNGGYRAALFSRKRAPAGTPAHGAKGRDHV